MIRHPSISVLVPAAGQDPALKPFLSYLESVECIRLTATPHLPEDLSPYDVILTGGEILSTGSLDSLERFVRRGGGWLGLFGGSTMSLPDLFGVRLGPPGLTAELRVMFPDPDHPLALRMPDALFVSGHVQAIEKRAEDTETLLHADWRHTHIPVLVSRAVGEGVVACTTLQAYGQPRFQQILYRAVLLLAGRRPAVRSAGVGILGYSRFIGQAHGMGIEATDGLALRAACDVNPERLRQARGDFPGIKTHGSPDLLARDPDVDLVIVATPPNLHARHALDMMEAGKHVVCEKPLALCRRETDAMVETADRKQVLLCCHQNRRWDVDYLALKAVVEQGQIGELFYMETFVGGFGHPCGYWHSHDEISGGTAYDWGGHYLDWIVSLIPERVEAVIGTRHKRVWHDVTNADQERVQVRFAGGKEAEFLHSDIAAVRKPKWFLLGTEGAVVGHWRDVAVYELDPVVYFHEHGIPATEMTPNLTLCRRDPAGQVVTQRLPVPRREPFLFHRNLADHLLTGEPLEAPLEDSVKVVAILEAAVRSAEQGGTVELLHA